MRKCCFYTIFLLSLDYANSQNPTGGNEVGFDDQKVVTLGPPRDGFQRAVFDEVPMNDLGQLPVEDITQSRNDLDAYDDKFVDLREEEPLFIPKAYRNETTKATPSIAAATGGGGFTFTTTGQPLQTFGRSTPVGAVGRTFVPVSSPAQPAFPAQPPFRPAPAQPFPQAAPGFIAQPPPQPPRLVAQQQLPTQLPFRPETVPQVPQFVPQPQPPRFSLPAPVTSQPTQTVAPAPTPALTPAQQPIRPRPQPPHMPPRIGPPRPRISPESLRTGVCHASIFYISTPLESPTRHTFTHFAITVSTDQCARTCHEFNCAIAHYDPSSGRCQFNPSTAFAIRQGQCPPWPATHYKNNIRTSIPLRIFCVQCHRPIRRGRNRNRGNRFRTTHLRTHFTGRMPNSLQRSGFARAQSILLAQPGVIINSSIGDINSKLVKQSEREAVGSNQQQKSGYLDTSDKNGTKEGVNNEDKQHSIDKQALNDGEFINESVNYSKFVLKKVERSNSRTIFRKPERTLKRGSGIAVSNTTEDAKTDIVRVKPSDFASAESDFQ